MCSIQPFNDLSVVLDFHLDQTHHAYDGVKGRTHVVAGARDHYLRDLLQRP